MTFSRDMSNPAPFTLTQVTASVTGADGSAEVPANLEMVTYSGKVQFRGTDQITLDVYKRQIIYQDQRGTSKPCADQERLRLVGERPAIPPPILVE